MKTARKKAVVVDCAFPDLERERAAAAAGDASFVALQNAAESEIVEALRDADLVFAQFARIPEAAVAAMRTGAVIVRYGVGLDNLPLAACAARGVRVCNVPDYGAEEVADHALAMLLGLHRRLPQLDAAVRAGEWGGDDRADAVAPIDSLTLGILGFGRIGRAVAKRAAAFGVACAACDPAADEEAIHAAGATPVALAELWRRADWLSLHAPSTPATRQILNRESLAQTKRGVIVVNCARGDLINESDLAAALRSGAVAAAGLDVFSAEPLAADSPLRDAPNLILTPHIAWRSCRALPRLQQLAAEEGLRALRGEPLRCEIRPDA